MHLKAREEVRYISTNWNKYGLFICGFEGLITFKAVDIEKKTISRKFSSNENFSKINEPPWGETQLRVMGIGECMEEETVFLVTCN